MPMQATNLQKLIWVLIYGGLLTFVLSVFVNERDPALALMIGVPGGIIALIGFVLIGARARMKTDVK